MASGKFIIQDAIKRIGVNSVELRLTDKLKLKSNQLNDFLTFFVLSPILCNMIRVKMQNDSRIFNHPERLKHSPIPSLPPHIFFFTIFSRFLKVRYFVLLIEARNFSNVLSVITNF